MSSGIGIKREASDDESSIDPSLVSVPGYDCNDINQETNPASINFSPSYATLKESCTKLLSKLDTAILDTRDPECIRRCTNSPTVILQDEQLSARRIAVLGDMASGKSSLINALLGLGTIARKGDSGESCTWVTQHYRRRFPEQGAKIAAKVHFQDHKVTRELLKDLLDTYARAVAPNDGELPGKARTLDADQASDVDDVVKILSSLFCHIPQLSDDERILKFLDTDMTQEVRLDILCGHAAKLVNAHLKGELYVYREAQTAKELIEAIRPYTHRSEDNAEDKISDPWPLVARIEYGLDTVILMQGAILIDAPGISDSSAFRRANAQDALREADHVVVVASIARVLSDRQVRLHLELATKSHGARNTILVLTRADELDIEGDVVGATREQRLALGKIEASIAEGKKRQSELEKSRSKSLKKEKQTLKTTLQDLDEKQFTLRLLWRKKHICNTLKKQLRTTIKDAEHLQIFPVGNNAYEKHRSGFKKINAPTISLRATGIPQLRSHIRSLPASSMLELCKSAVNVLIPKKILDFEQALASLAAPVSVKARLDCTGAHRVQIEVSRIVEQMTQALKKHVIRPMINERLASWNTEALGCVLTWKKLQTKDHLCLLRHNGRKAWSRRQDGLRLIDWNQDLVDIGKNELDEWFANLHEDIAGVIDDAPAAYRSQFNDIVQTLQAKAKLDRKELAQCEAHMDLQLQALSHRLQRLFAYRIAPRLRQLNARAGSASEGGYIVQMARPIYQEASLMLYGKNVARRLALIERKIVHESLWRRMSEAIERDGKNIFHDVTEVLTRHMTEIDNDIENTCNRLQSSAVSKHHTIVKDMVDKATAEIAEMRHTLNDSIKPQLNSLIDSHKISLIEID